jgi:hypothetical protein
MHAAGGNRRRVRIGHGFSSHRRCARSGADAGGSRMRGGVRRRRWLTAAALAVLLVGGPLWAQTVLDDFDTVEGWSATASDPGVKVELASDPGELGMAMRIDFDFAATGGHVLVRKAFALDLPANYAFTFDWRGAAPPIDVEFKLIDRNEANVWWYRWRDVTLPGDWTAVRIKKPRLEFAWGPASGGPPRNIAFIELAITGAVGDRGSLWLDDLRLVPRPPARRVQVPPVVSASTSLPGHDPKLVLDDSPYTTWQSGALAAEQWLQLDFGTPREFAGVVIDWDGQDYAVAYDVDLSDDGQTWTTVFRSTRGNGHRDHVFIPDAEARYLRIAMHASSRKQGYVIGAVRVIPIELAASPNEFVAGLAAENAPGLYPRYFSNQQVYWTVIGANGDDNQALFSADGMLEPYKGGFSLEPFLFMDGTLVSWPNVAMSQQLEDGYLPIPSVTWSYDTLSLTITALVAGPPGTAELLARYRVENRAPAARDLTLFLAVWPFQVLPPWQNLNMVGGVAPIHDLVFDLRTLWVDRKSVILPLTPPARFGASTTDEGPIGDFLSRGVLPERTEVSDPYGFASGAMQFDLHVAAGGHEDVYVAVPYGDLDAAVTRANPLGAEEQFARAFEGTKRDWTRLLGCVELLVPPAAQTLPDVVKTTLAYILINRNAAALQPGPRTYSRSWIRDGALSGAALLEMGFPQEVRDFIRWYAGYQYPDGKIPCCVDRHGADPLPEHDSNGEFLYALGSYYRYTRDIRFVHDLWPSALGAVAYLDALRAPQLGEEFRKGSKRAFYGLLPPSVSHEGYISHPVHSYWDDFFAVRGLDDATTLANALGEADAAARIAATRDGLQNDLLTSIATVIAEHKLEYLPASADLADFDPSSTAIALSAVGELPYLPEPQTAQTFQRYVDEFSRRVSGEAAWEGYAPYELRNVGALVRLDRRADALAVLNGLLADRRPLAWNQWPEVIWHDPTAPKFIGDMPHTWVGAGYIRAVRDLFAYERLDESALVLAAGVPAEWLAGATPIGVRRMPTPYGVLNYTLEREGGAALRCRVFGDLDTPPGGIVLMPPLPGPLRAASVNGHAVPFERDRVRVHEFPVDALLEY